jgi:hypothetical protein
MVNIAIHQIQLWRSTSSFRRIAVHVAVLIGASEIGVRTIEEDAVVSQLLS